MQDKKLVFYTNPMSRGRMVRWALEEVGASYETRVMEYDSTMKSAEYLAINPMGKVPAIQHGATIVTECAAICAYLADAFPEAGLAPPLNARGDYYRGLFFAAGPLEAAVMNKSCGFEAPDKERMLGYGNYDLAVDTFAKMISDRDFIAGDSFTMADVYVGAHVGWGVQFGSLPERPEFTSYWARVSDREAWRRANAMDDALMPADAG